MSASKEAPIVALEGFERQPTTKEVLSALPFSLRLLWDADRRSILWQALASVFYWVGNAAYLFAVGRAVDALIARDLASVWFSVLLFAIGAVADVIGGFLMEYYSDVQRHRTEFHLARRVLELLRAVPYRIIEDPRFRMLQQAYERKSYVLMSLANTLMSRARDVAKLLGMLTIVFVLPWQATAVLLASQIIMLAFGRKAGEYQWSILSMETREGRRGWYYQETVQNPRGLLALRTLGLARSFYRRWRSIVERLLEERIRLSRHMALGIFWSNLVRGIGFVGGLILIIQSVLRGEVSTGVAAMYIGSFELIGDYLQSIMRSVSWLQTEGSVFPIIKRFFSLPVESDTGKSIPRGALTVSLEDVWFRYPGSETDVLRGITLSFTAADHIAIVGLNGAGKSTLLKLLLGVYEPTRGSIRVNGVDVREIRRSDWQGALAVLNQDVFVFDDTVREQIRYGNYEKREDARRLAMATRVSGLDSVLAEMPGGLDTHAGRVWAMPEDNAIEFSGGQNQILAIARTLYRDARIFIFDEPTAAVDAEKEERFFEALPDALQGRAVLFVSHRFSTLRRARRIIVLDQGRVIEEGPHEELLEKRGRYAELFTLQAKMYQ